MTTDGSHVEDKEQERGSYPSTTSHAPGLEDCGDSQSSWSCFSQRCYLVATGFAWSQEVSWMRNEMSSKVQFRIRVQRPRPSHWIIPPQSVCAYIFIHQRLMYPLSVLHINEDTKAGLHWELSTYVLRQYLNTFPLSKIPGSKFLLVSWIQMCSASISLRLFSLNTHTQKDSRTIFLFLQSTVLKVNRFMAHTVCMCESVQLLGRQK